MLLPGDRAPFFEVASSVNPRFCFDTIAGRYIVMSFFGSTQVPSSEQFLTEIVQRGHRFDVTNLLFLGVTNDPEDVQHIKAEHPGRIYFYDLNLAVSRKFGVVRNEAPAPAARSGQDGQAAGEADGPGESRASLTRKTFILDQALRIVAIIEMSDGTVAKQIETIFSILDSLPKLQSLQAAAPVLIVPYVFEPEMCKQLINYYESHGGEDSGFMREENGRTVGVLDYSHKRRMDCEITDDGLIKATQERIKRRLVPAIRQAYQFDATRIERHIVACYDAAQGAHFRAHRDNTTLGTAHRRYAVTINLNSHEYEGGEIWFPEFGPKRYKPDSGSAIIFSCSLLHEVPKVTQGRRYAFLPFLYDEAAAEVRAQNRKYLGNVAGAAGKSSPPTACGTDSVAVASAQGGRMPIIDGSAGCGHPEGCQTCLTSATYELGKPRASHPPADAPDTFSGATIR